MQGTGGRWFPVFQRTTTRYSRVLPLTLRNRHNTSSVSQAEMLSRASLRDSFLAVAPAPAMPAVSVAQKRTSHVHARRSAASASALFAARPSDRQAASNSPHLPSRRYCPAAPRLRRRGEDHYHRHLARLVSSSRTCYVALQGRLRGVP